MSGRKWASYPSRRPRRHIGFLAVVLAALSVPSVLGSAASGATTYKPPASIDRTGSTDVTNGLNKFFASVPDGSVITFPDHSRYRVEGTLYLRSRNDLRIEGNRAMFVARTDGRSTPAPVTSGRANLAYLWPRHRAVWLVDGGTDIVVRNLVIRGANPKAGASNDAYVESLEAQHGVEFMGVAGATLENATITDTYGDLASVTWGASNVTVQNNVLLRSGRQAVTVDRAEDVMVRANRVEAIGRSAFDLEPAAADWALRRITIESNTVRAVNGVFIAGLGVGGLMEDITVTGNTVSGEALEISVRATDGARRRNFTITNNTSDIRFGGPLAAMRFTRVDGLVVSGNRQAMFGRFIDGNGEVVYSGTAVNAAESCDIAVDANFFDSATLALKTTDGYVCPAD